MFPWGVLIKLFANLYHLCSDSAEFRNQHHFCSLAKPCVLVSLLFQHVYVLRQVSSEWNKAFLAFRSSKEYRFLRKVEDVYYPYAWHINSKVRSSVLLHRYRVFNTIDTEDGDRGVFRAYDFGSPSGCNGAKIVIIKAWNNSSDEECVTEARVYRALQSHSISGVPSLLASSYDEECQVYALVIEALGDSLEDLLHITPGNRFSEEMVLAVAIQLLDRYESLHRIGVIHNGIKPGNICVSGVSSPSSQLNIIDFGLSYHFDWENGCPLPSADRSRTVGNRRFLSALGHHGISHSQRDDLESLGYLFSFLFHGSLPWDLLQTIKPRKRRTHQPPSAPVPEIWRVKISTPGSVLFRDMDHAFLRYWKDVKSLAFGEVPDYNHLKSQFVKSWEAKGIHAPPGEFNWISYLKELKRHTVGHSVGNVSWNLI